MKAPRSKLAKYALYLALLTAMAAALWIALRLWSDYASDYIRRHLDEGTFISVAQNGHARRV